MLYLDLLLLYTRHGATINLRLPVRTVVVVHGRTLLLSVLHAASIPHPRSLSLRKGNEAVVFL
ncbi:MAG: hypothetical protein JWQ09_4157 [Segetibacter sp.]|nr:hypothetical protein [Segetibacter sp.]